MIAIVNQDKKNDQGETLYNLQINNALIVTFYHKREDSLSRCLEIAACAARRKETNDMIELLNCKLKG